MKISEYNEYSEYSEGPMESMDFTRSELADKYYDLRSKLLEIGEMIEKNRDYIPSDSTILSDFNTGKKTLQDLYYFWDVEDYKYLKDCNKILDELSKVIESLEAKVEKVNWENLPEEIKEREIDFNRLLYLIEEKKRLIIDLILKNKKIVFDNNDLISYNSDIIARLEKYESSVNYVGEDVQFNMGLGIEVSRDDLVQDSNELDSILMSVNELTKNIDRKIVEDIKEKKDKEYSDFLISTYEKIWLVLNLIQEIELIILNNRDVISWKSDVYIKLLETKIKIEVIRELMGNIRNNIRVGKEETIDKLIRENSDLDSILKTVNEIAEFVNQRINEKNVEKNKMVI